MDEMVPKIISDEDDCGVVPLVEAALRAASTIQRQIGLGLVDIQAGIFISRG